MECSLVNLFHWPLNDIDNMDIESLIPFVQRFPHWKRRESSPGRKQIFADQADWL